MGREYGTFEGDEKCTDRMRGTEVDGRVILHWLKEKHGISSRLDIYASG
jgi:hypothetical protein